MLKSILTRRRKTKYTILSVYPIANIDSLSDEQIEDAMQAHVIRLQRIVSLLGYRPRQVTAAMYEGGINARAIVRATSDQKIEELVTVINLSMEGSDVNRVATIDRVDPRDRRLVPLPTWVTA